MKSDNSEQNSPLSEVSEEVVVTGGATGVSYALSEPATTRLQGLRRDFWDAQAEMDRLRRRYLEFLEAVLIGMGIDLQGVMAEPTNDLKAVIVRDLTDEEARQLKAANAGN